MSVTLNDVRTNATRPQFRNRRAAISRWRHRTPDRRHATQTAMAEEAFVANCVIALALLGVTPLMLYLAIHYLPLWL